MKPRPVAWRYCSKCGQALALYHYPFNYCSDYRDDIKRELDNLEYEHRCPPVSKAPPAGEQKEERCRL